MSAVDTTNMRLLAIVSGEYGQRHVTNIRTHGPSTWTIETWQAPAVLPPVVDYPEDHLPESFPPADLILSFAELPGVAELLPDIAPGFVIKSTAPSRRMGYTGFIAIEEVL